MARVLRDGGGARVPEREHRGVLVWCAMTLDPSPDSVRGDVENSVCVCRGATFRR